jgi:MYXO-CTERM domain-containing protein
MSTQGRLLRFVAVVTFLSGCTMGGTDDLVGLGGERSPIVGGTPESGYLGVGLLVFDEGGGAMSMCTGTTIADNWVLTAGHCVDGKAPAAGAFFSGDDMNDESSGDWYSIRSLHPHADYDASGPTNDIALVEVAGLTGMTTYTVNTTAPTRGLAVTFVGYGLNDPYDDTSSGIKRRGGGQVSDFDWMTLLHYSVGGVNPCSGDSGGPVFATISGSQRVIGVISTADETCSEMSTSTRVDAYNDWIDDTMAGGTTPDCDIRGGDCGGDACWPVSATEYTCYPSDGLANGAACNADSTTWESLPCGDGMVCAPTSETDPTAGICVAFCMGDGDCAADEGCSIPAFEDIADVGICVPGGGPECNILGGDCASGEGCFPSQAGTNNCFASDELARGAECNDDMGTWTNLPCDDGLICISIAEGAPGTCRDFCLGAGDCGADEDCYAPIFEGIADIGVCVPGEGCTDSDGDGSCAGDDCDDREPAAYPGAAERCSDGIDNDCDGATDEDCEGCTDADADGYCSTVDCVDSDADVYPGQVEDCGDGIDNNCDGRADSADEDCGGGDGDGDSDSDGDVHVDNGCRCSAGPTDPGTGGDAVAFVVALFGLAVLRRGL